MYVSKQKREVLVINNSFPSVFSFVFWIQKLTLTQKLNERSSYLRKGKIRKIFEKRSMFNGRKEIYVNSSVSRSILVELVQVASTNFTTNLVLV